MDMNTVRDVGETIRPSAISWIGAAAGVIVGWWTGLPALMQAMLVAQGADFVTGVIGAGLGKSPKSESGKLSSNALLMGALRKGLEWLVVWVCIVAGNAVGITGVGAAAMTYMVATELVSFIENLGVLGLKVPPVLQKILEIAKKKDGNGEPPAAA